MTCTLYDSVNRNTMPFLFIYQTHKMYFHKVCITDTSLGFSLYQIWKGNL